MMKEEMMMVRKYDYLEDFDSFITEIHGTNEKINELFENLFEEEILVPLLAVKPKLKSDRDYHILIETTASGHSWFWVYPNHEEQEIVDYLVSVEMLNLEETLEEIRKNHY